MPECPSYFCHRFGLRHRSLRFQITHVGGGPVQSILSSFPPISLASFTCINFTEAEGDFRQCFPPVLLLKTLKWCIYMQPDRQTDYEVNTYSYRERFLFPNIQLDRQRFHDVQLQTAFSRYASRDSVMQLETAFSRYKDTKIYAPMAFKCTQEFVLVTSHSYSALPNRQNITISHV